MLGFPYLFIPVSIKYPHFEHTYYTTNSPIACFCHTAISWVAERNPYSSTITHTTGCIVLAQPPSIVVTFKSIMGLFSCPLLSWIRIHLNQNTPILRSGLLLTLITLFTLPRSLPLPHQLTKNFLRFLLHLLLLLVIKHRCCHWRPQPYYSEQMLWLELDELQMAIPQWNVCCCLDQSHLRTRALQ